MTELTPSLEAEFSTPMMLQYLEVKKQYPDCILFFRLGDFYEMFLEDAKIGAEILGITLTSRARGKDGRIPMAGVPYHAAETYLAKLIKAGYRVAICEQVTQPDGRNLVERKVIRIVTPGTVVDEKTLPRKQNNYLLSCCLEKDVLGIACADVSTGEFQVAEFSAQEHVPLEQLVTEVLTHLQPAEYLLSGEVSNNAQLISIFIKQFPRTISPFDHWPSTSRKAKQILTDHFRRAPQNTTILTMLSEHPQALRAGAALLAYLQHTQRSALAHMHLLKHLQIGNYLRMDRSTMSNLELFHTLREEQKKGSLLEVLDYTHTPMGGRLLKQWLIRPLVQKAHIEERLDAVTFFHTQRDLRLQIQEVLAEISDVERCLSRLSVGMGTPRDLKSVELSLERSLGLKELLQSSTVKGRAKNKSSLPVFLGNIIDDIQAELSEVVALIKKTIIDQPPIDPRQGHLIHRGVHERLDALRDTVHSSRDWIMQLELAERAQTGISSLKIKFNQVFGFYIEVSKTNLHLVPASYMRKQTLVNAERFITPELKKHEDIILHAEEEMKAIEYELFTQLLEQVLAHVATLQKAAAAVARLDCLASFAEVAEVANYTRPTLTESGELTITQGRHPVLEQLMEPHQFIPNDVCLDTKSHQLLLITGPNMAGKSVVMRQIALITLLAHIGSFVPAEKATISLTDQIFVRSGAADMITAGLSTFMVEMLETAYILQHATERSLVVMDEIGRGTSTYDGISIAWAVAEHLVTHPTHTPKTLFATHYHELQALAEKFPKKVQNYHMKIAEHHGKPVFLYSLNPGSAPHSFGVAVAELAGVPSQVISRAQELLKEMETHAPATKQQSKKSSSEGKALTRELQALHLDTLSPIEALNTLVAWKEKYGKN